jgi:2',3'-cyclic-nucleotide 2'-phosphodiesterase (5'-nucleotidase family)
MQIKMGIYFIIPCLTGKILIPSTTPPVMKRKYYSFYIIASFVVISSACRTTYQSQALQYKSYRINEVFPKDSSVLSFLTPYSHTVNTTMNDVVGVAEKALDKTQPEGTLGNFMADALLEMAREKYNTKVDVALVNFGGIRLTQLAAGNVTNGKIFELMPFDNLLIIQKLKGDVLQQLLDLSAGKGGWPVAGMTMKLKNKKAVDVLIDGKPLDLNAVYTVANSDFVANGGDNADMLRTIAQIANGYLMRDAILEYIKKLKAQGKNITANIENRVINAQ